MRCATYDIRTAVPGPADPGTLVPDYRTPHLRPIGPQVSQLSVTALGVRLARAVIFVSLAVLAGCNQNAPAPAARTTDRASADKADTSGFAIVRLDPALDAIISSDAALVTIGDRFGLTEGPVWVQDDASGHLLFSDLISNVIYKWTPDGQFSAFLENVYDGPDILNVGQQTRRGRMNVLIIGANGLTLDREKRLIVASPASRAVFRLEKDGTRTVLADRYQGKRFNGPNDVVVKSNGSIYFTDGNSGLRGGANSPLREIQFNGFYLVRDSTVTLVGSNKEFSEGFPNGIALSPDEKHLYVTIGRKIMRYQVQPDDWTRTAMCFRRPEPGRVRSGSPRARASVSGRFGFRSRQANRGSRSVRPTWDSVMRTAKVSTSPRARMSITSGSIRPV